MSSCHCQMDKKFKTAKNELHRENSIFEVVFINSGQRQSCILYVSNKIISTDITMQIYSHEAVG